MKVFFGSMAGRVFLVLTLGMFSTWALARWLAVGERQRVIEQYRDMHMLERAEQLLVSADLVPAESRAAYLAVNSRHAVRFVPLTDAAPAAANRSNFATALATRVGPAFQVESVAESASGCRATPGMGRGRGLPGPSPSPGIGPCESVSVQLHDGQRLRLTLLPPRTLPALHRAELSTTTLALFVLCIGVLAYVVARMTTQPLARLAQAAADLGHDINHPPLALRGATDIRQASAAFNAMQARIRDYVFQRTQMLAAITHDLQTPLTRLRLRLEKVADPELQERLIGDLSAMQSMVREGLALARSMDSTETKQALDLDSLLDSVCADAADAGQDVTLSGRANMAVMGRPTDLRRALVNLIDNAVKYGQRARVSVRGGGAVAIINIRDHGPGLAPGDIDRVFEPFYRVESSRSRESGGTGLGLTIARNIAHQHGGTIMLENLPEGGLDVMLTLPGRDSQK